MRSNEVDIIRLGALVGICVVNVPFMALPPEAVFIPPNDAPDKFAGIFVECFFQLKFFILFSFIFGWGMAIQAKSAAAKKRNFEQIYSRRMFGLGIIGAAHAILVFSGDILVLYAILGRLLWLVRDYAPRKLMRLAVWMLPLSMACLTLLALAIDTLISGEFFTFTAEVGVGKNLSETVSSGLGGGFGEATLMRLADWPVTFVFLLLLQGPLAFAAFAAGLAAAKSEFFARESFAYSLLRKRVPLLLLVGLPLNALYAAVVGGLVPESFELLSLLGFVLVALGAPALSMVYLVLLIELSRKLPVPNVLVLAGKNSLSTYIAQGAIAGLLFGAYGLGLYNTLGNVELFAVSLGIAVTAILLVGGYASAFGRGPLEPVLRKIARS